MKILKYNVLLLFICCLSLNAQVDLQSIEFTGKVHQNGKGISGVAVTDGYNIVLTDKKGEYKLASNATAQFVYITLPSGYNIPMEDNAPRFFERINDTKKQKQRIDFALTKSKTDDNKHILIAWADPQVYYEEEMPKVKETAGDVRHLVEQYYPNMAVIGLVCGDIVADANKEPLFYPRLKQYLSDTQIPFFYLAGNHDLNLDVQSDFYAKDTYKNTFGPTYYSYNRGKIHYIVLDDVFYAGRSYFYIGYIDEVQLNWLQQDLALVPQGATVVVSLHIPTYSPEARRGEYGKEEMGRVLQNRSEFYKMLKSYNVHILSGHEHRTENFLIAGNLFEHSHGALCGLFWQTPWCYDGTPLGYTVYEFDGDEVSWYFKGVGKNRDEQFSVYGIGQNIEKPDAITVNVWNYDPAWKVYWYENGQKMGEMTQYKGDDPNVYHYSKKHKESFKHKWISSKPTEHLFFAKPQSADSQIAIEVVDRFGKVYTLPCPTKKGE